MNRAMRTLVVLLVSSFLVFPALAIEYDLVVKWKSEPLYSSEKQPGVLGMYQIMADMDGDGKYELPISMLRGKRTMIMLNYTGGIAWQFHDRAQWDMHQLAIADVTGDSKKEIIWISSMYWANRSDPKPQVNCHNIDGEELWIYPLEGGAGCWTCVTTYDIDGDGKDEIFVPDKLANIYCLEGDGTLIWEHKVGTGWNTINPSIGDVTGDGKPECVVINCQNLTILDAATGSVIFNTNESGGFAVRNAIGGTALVDLYPEDPGLEIVVAGPSRAMCINGKGELKWQFNGTVEHPVAVTQDQITVGDVDGDGKLNFVFGTFNNTVYALEPDGSQLWMWVGPEEDNIYGVQAGQAIADIDGDGVMEVLWTSWDGNLYVADGRIGVIEAQYTFPEWKIGFASPMVGDVDGDGRLEIVVAAGDNVVYCFAAPVQETGDVIWPLWRLNPENNAVFVMPVPEGLPALFGVVSLAVGILMRRRIGG